MARITKHHLDTREKDTLRDSFNEAYCIARNLGSMRENDQARLLLAETGRKIKSLYTAWEKQNPSPAKGPKAAMAGEICQHLTGRSYLEFLNVRDVILSRTGAAGHPIPTID